jgi:hypothetical protein
MHKLNVISIIILAAIINNCNSDPVKIGLAAYKKTKGPVDPTLTFIDNERIEFARNLVNESKTNNQKNQYLPDIMTSSGNIIFTQIPKQTYTTLIYNSFSGNIPICDSSDYVVEDDSCIFIYTSSGIFDTLCDVNLDMDIKKYDFITDWKLKNQLLFHHQSNTEKFYFFINEANNEVYYFYEQYSLTRNQDWIITYTNDLDKPVIENHFKLAFIGSDRIYPIFNLVHSDFAIRQAVWLSNDLLLIWSFSIDKNYAGYEGFDFYYVMEIIV